MLFPQSRRRNVRRKTRHSRTSFVGFGTSSSVLKVAFTTGLLAFGPAAKGPIGDDRMSNTAFIASTAGLAAFAPSIKSIAYNLLAPQVVHRKPAKVAFTSPTRTVSMNLKPTATKASQSGMNTNNASYAAALCASLSVAGAALVLGDSGQGGSSEGSSSSGDAENGSAPGDIPENGIGGNSSPPPPGDAPGDPSNVNNESETPFNGSLDHKGDAGGSPPPPPPPSHTTSAMDGDHNGSPRQLLDWKAVIVALAVLAALSKFSKRRTIIKPSDNELANHMQIKHGLVAHTTAPLSGNMTENAKVPVSRDVLASTSTSDVGLFAAASSAAVAAAQFWNTGARHPVSSIPSEDGGISEDINALVLPDALNFPRESTTRLSPLVFAAGPLDPAHELDLDFESTPYDDDDDNEYTELHFDIPLNDPLYSILSSGSRSSPESENTSPLEPSWSQIMTPVKRMLEPRWDQTKTWVKSLLKYLRDQITFVKSILLFILLGALPYLSRLITRLAGGTVSRSGDVLETSQYPTPVPRIVTVILDDEIIGNSFTGESKPFNYCTCKDGAPIKFLSEDLMPVPADEPLVSASETSKEVVKVEACQEVPIEDDAVDEMAAAFAVQCSVSFPAVPSGPVKEAQVADALHSCVSLPTSLNAPSSPSLNAAAAPFVPGETSRVSFSEEVEVYSIPVVGGGERHRRRRGRRNHTRAGRNNGHTSEEPNWALAA